MKTLLLQCCLAFGGFLSAADLIHEVGSGEFRRRVYLVERLSAQIVESDLNRLRTVPSALTGIVVAQYFESESDFEAYCKCINHSTFENWSPVASELRKSLPPVAEAILIDGVGVLRVRDRSGLIAETRIGDAPQTSSLNRKCVVDLASIEVPAEVTDYVATLFVRAKPIDRVCVELSLSPILSRATAGPIRVAIREDFWFVAESGFPVVYPFVQPEPIPTREWYQASRQEACIAVEARLRRCSW